MPHPLPIAYQEYITPLALDGFLQKKFIYLYRVILWLLIIR